jgi:hypothetical protein
MKRSLVRTTLTLGGLYLGFWVLAAAVNQAGKIGV